jgi:phosphoribosylformimino-5-aminoimidazole carboxamide ribotide isomerase
MIDILPAIDLRDGKCVRLLQGDYDRQIDYADDPVAVARQFESAGATWLHIVDLDGARQGIPANLETIARIIQSTRLAVEVGGGIRTDETVAALFGAGARRVVIGTRALEDWDWFRSLVHRPGHEGRIALGLDARDGNLAVKGWTEQTRHPAVEVARRVEGWPLGAIIYTDISRDGMLVGPNIEALREMAETSPVPVIASGGVTTLDDVQRLLRLPIGGIIIGRTLYEGKLDLAEVLRLQGRSGL